MRLASPLPLVTRIRLSRTDRCHFAVTKRYNYASLFHRVFSLLEMSASSPYTCITCHVAFNNGELQRAHYKTDWHRYNLKRKVADLGPISANEFTEKVEAIQQQNSAKTIESNDRSTFSCKECGKGFTSENGMLNHTKSKKHLETVARNANLPVSKACSFDFIDEIVLLCFVEGRS